MWEHLAHGGWSLHVESLPKLKDSCGRVLVLCSPMSPLHGHTWRHFSALFSRFGSSLRFQNVFTNPQASQLSGHLHIKHESEQEWKTLPPAPVQGYVHPRMAPPCVIFNPWGDGMGRRWRKGDVPWLYWLLPSHSPEAVTQSTAGESEDSAILRCLLSR